MLTFLQRPTDPASLFAQTASPDVMRPEFVGIDGFLGTRGSFMMDFVFLAMLAVVPIMFASIYLARFQHKFQLHKVIQLVLATALLLAVVAFETEVRLTGEAWRLRSEPSPFYVEGSWNDWIDYTLAIHLLFAIPAPFLWGIVIYRALRHFPRPAAPSAHSRAHRIWGRLAAIVMTATAVTGWCFYYLAFVA
ncbi:MAG: DUF420 domain-containing protein [Pirellulaceae bacterium]